MMKNLKSNYLKNIFMLALVIFFSVEQLFAMSKPESCKNVNLDRFMQAGQVADAPPDKIYKFTEMRAELLRSLETSRNMECYADFYQSALSEVGDYWGGRLAQAGCEVNARGEISGSCPEASEARRSVQFVKNLDRELRTKVKERLAESREARNQARGAAGSAEECATDRRGPEAALANTKEVTCCGTKDNNGGVVRAVLPGTNYNSCLGKVRPTNQSFFSGSGLADCLGNAVKGAAQMLWDSISSIFKLPGELWAARSQIWALITKPEARAQFARALMQQFKAFFTDRVEAFSCFNDYEKAQYVCRVGGQIVATAALPQTIGAFLGLATKPVGAAARAITQILQKSPRGNSILGGIEKANEAAAKGLRAAGSAARRAGTAADDLSGGRLSAAADRAGGAGRTAAGVTRAVGRPISILAEKLAARIENSATFQRMFVNSFRAEKTAMGSAPSTALARAQVLEGEVLPPAPRPAATPSNAPRLANDNIIEGEFREIVEAPRLAGPSQAARLDVADDVPRMPAPDSPDVPRLPAPDSPDVPRLPPPDSPSSSGAASTRTLSDSDVDDFVLRNAGRENLRVQDLDAAGSLSDPQRVRAAQGILQRDLTPEQSDALLRAHGVGSERGFGRYTDQDIEQKREILRNAGYSRRETETLLWKGVAGNNPYLDVQGNTTNLTRFMGGRQPTTSQVEAVIKTHTMRERSVDERIKVLTDAGFNPGMAREIATLEHHRTGGRSAHLNSPSSTPSAATSTQRPTTSYGTSSSATRPSSAPATATRPSASLTTATRPSVAPTSAARPNPSPAAAPTRSPSQTAAPSGSNSTAQASTRADAQPSSQAATQPPAAPPSPAQLQRQAAAETFRADDPIVKAGDLSALNRTSAQKTLDEMVLKYNNRTRLSDEVRATHALDRFQEDVSQIYKLKEMLSRQTAGSKEAEGTLRAIRAYQYRCRAWSTLYRTAGYTSDGVIRLFDRDIARVCND